MNLEFNHMTNHLTGPLLDFYLLYLAIDHPSQLRFDYDVFLSEDIELDDPDELWQLPQPEKFTALAARVGMVHYVCPELRASRMLVVGACLV